MQHPAISARSHAQPTHAHAQPLHSYLVQTGPQSQGVLFWGAPSDRPMLAQHHGRQPWIGCSRWMQGTYKTLGCKQQYRPLNGTQPYLCILI